MTTRNYTFVSYLGGSAGDLFVTSANGHQLGNLTVNHVTPINSLKKLESKIKSNQLTLSEALDQIPIPSNGFVSTHLFEEIILNQWKLVNIVIKDPAIQEQIILRQMQLQKLSIKVDPAQSWYMIVKTFCQNQKYNNAALYWFEQSRKFWLDQMKSRLATTYGTQLNFDQLLTSNFTQSLVDQGWTTNIDSLSDNHKKWLPKNQNFSKQKTIESIAEKLRSMDWTLTSGYVTCV